MAERENLPAVIAAQAVAVQTEKRGSLVGRGLMALRNDNDALYRQARAVFNQKCYIGTPNIPGLQNDWSTDDDPSIPSAFKIFQKLADENYGKAYYPLSILYGGRNDIEDSKSHALHYTQLALEWCLANQSNDDAELWCDFGCMCWMRNDREQAEILLRKAAEKGNARSQWILGDCIDMLGEEGNYWRELAVKQWDARIHVLDLLDHADRCEHSKQYQKAAYWYRKVAEQGDGCGQFNLGKMYKEGLGVEQNDEQAVYWIRKAAEQGYEPGQKELGYMYSEGRSVAQDYEQAEYWFSKADWPPYEISANYYYAVPPNDEQAVYWLRKAAEQGDEHGQWELGEMFANGRGVAQDNEQAEYWFRKAAEQADSSYQNELGEMYKEGRGVSHDDKQAVYWFTKAAEQGDEYGQFNLGLMYEDGRGVAQDGASKMTPQGRKIWDSPAGVALLGRMLGGQPKTATDSLVIEHLKKTGRTQNDEQAVYWFRKAAEQGHADAQQALKKLGLDWKK